MSGFRNDETGQAKEYSFKNKLDELVLQYEGYGRAGVQYVDKSYTGEKHMVDTSMDDAIFDLGCEIKNHPSVTPFNWAAWMRDCAIENGKTVIFRMRSSIFCTNAKLQFSEALKAHFQKPVEFLPDRDIRRMVNKRKG